MIVLEPVPAAPIREELRRRGYEPMEGSHNLMVEFWIRGDGSTICLPYFVKGDFTRFEQIAVQEALGGLIPNPVVPPPGGVLAPGFGFGPHG